MVLTAAKEGDQDAISTLYLAFGHRVLAYLRSRIGQDADDVASETWMSIAKSLARFDGDEDDFRRWIFTIAHRRSIDWLRTASRFDLEVYSQDWDSVIGPGSDPAELISQKTSSVELLAKLASELPEEQARAVLLRVVGGLPTEDVAAILGKRPGATRMILHRALKSLAPLAEGIFENLSGDA